MRRIELVARDPEPDPSKREPDEDVIIDIPDPVRDEIFIDELGRTCSRWVGPREAIEANKIVNPLTAWLFDNADHVRVKERTEDEPEEWIWVRKSDGKIIVPK